MYNIYFYHFCIIYHTCYLVNLHKENGLFYHKTVHFLSSLVNLFTKLIFNNPIISAVIRIMISYYRKIIAEPFQRYKHNERCQIIMKSHSKVCIIQNNCCPLPLLNKLKGSLCNHSGGICRNQKQKRNTGFYNLQRSMTELSRLYHRTMRPEKFHSGNNTFFISKRHHGAGGYGVESFQVAKRFCHFHGFCLKVFNMMSKHFR